MNDTTATASQMTDLWRKGIEEGSTRMQAGFEELAKMERAASEQARTLITDVARMQQEGLTWANQMSAQWRRQGLELLRKGAELFTPHA